MRVKQKVQTHLKLNFSSDSDLKDLVEAWFAEGLKKMGHCFLGLSLSPGYVRPKLKSDAMAIPGCAPGNSGFSGRSQRGKIMVSGHC